MITELQTAIGRRDGGVGHTSSFAFPSTARVNFLRTITATFGLAALLSVFAPGASAGCGSFDEQKAPPAVRPEAPPARVWANLKPASFVLVSDDDSSIGEAPIVGLWSISFVAHNSPGIPDGTVVDAGYATWHGDGTEIMNSGRPPLTGSFCMGAWKQTGRRSYKLNHFALSWDPTGNVFVGPAQIQEEVTVDPVGKTYSGTFTIDQFDTFGNTLAHVQGRVTGTRVTVP